MADNIIIDFQVNDEGLQPVEDRLKDLGKVDAAAASSFKKTNTELAKRQAILKGIADGSQQVVLSVNKEQAVYNKLVTSLKTLSGESKKTVQTLLALNPKSLAKGFDDINVSVDEYVKTLQVADGATDDLTKGSISLKQQLKTLTAQITELKLSGDDTGESFNQLVEKAGKIKDAIADAGSEIKNFSSDTRTIDNVFGSVTALAGGFTAVQGAAAIFGDENKDLQETLVKVSASMAVLQGIQQLQNALQKEGALSLLALNIQQKVAVIQTQLLVATESEYVVVSGAATIATRVLNAAMAANPIGLFITALVAIVGVFAFFISRAHDAAVAQGELNQAFKNGTDGLEAYIEGSKRGLDTIISDLEKAGARQSDIQKEQGRQQADIINKRRQAIIELNKSIAQTEDSTNKDVLESRQKNIELRNKLEQDGANAEVEIHKQENETQKQLIKENLEDRLNAQKTILTNAKEGTKAQLAAQLELIKAQAALDTQDAGQDAVKVAAIQAQAAKDRLEAEVSFNRRIADLRKTQVETDIENAKTRDATNQELYILEIKRIQAEADAEVLNTKLSEAEKANIRKKANADRAAATKAFNEEDRKLAIQAEIDKNEVTLAQRNVSNADALQATIDNITLTAQIEIDATKNNAAKVAAIIADRDVKIRQARLSSIQKELQDELSLRASATGPESRAIAIQQAALDNSFAKRRISLQGYYNYSVELINAQATIELDTNQLAIDSLNATLKAKAISERDYNIEYQRLADERAKIIEDEEEKKRKAAKATKEQQKRDEEELLDFYVQTAGQLGNIALGFFQNQIDAQQIKIDAAKKNIQDLQDQGKISDKEASQRLHQLAKEEAKLKREQAQKDKEAALFEAAIGVAGAIIKAYYQLGPFGGAVGAAIAAAIGAAQIAVIASRPIPQFFRGKRPGLYEGFGEVAEHGPEAIRRDTGEWHVQKDRGLVWLGKNDQVFTAKETAAMVQTPTMRGNTMVVNNVPRETANPIDYDKLGKIINDHPVHVSIDGIEAMIMEGLQTTNMLNARRRYNK